MTKVHGKRYAYKFDFHALMQVISRFHEFSRNFLANFHDFLQACQSQGHDATGGYKYATEFSAAAGLFSSPACYQSPKLNGLTGAHLQVSFSAVCLYFTMWKFQVSYITHILREINL